MKKHKGILCLLIGILTLIPILCFISNPPNRNYNQNTLYTSTNFDFTENGQARIAVDYVGYLYTSGANIDITIEKKGLFFFWDDVLTESHTAQGESYRNEYFYDIDKEGTYRCTVVYTVFGEGDNDVITFQDTKTYRKNKNLSETTDTTASFMTETTAEETSSIPPSMEIPQISPTEFAKKLVSAMENRDVSRTNFLILKNMTVDGVAYETKIRTNLISDFRDESAPLYSYFSTAYSKTDQFEHYYIFADDTIYISVNGDRVQKPYAAEDLIRTVPRHTLSLLFGDRLYDEFSWSYINMHEDGTVTASVSFGFPVYKDAMIRLIGFLTTDDVSEQDVQNYDMVNTEITLDADGKLLSYVITFSCEIMRNGSFVPVTYRMEGTETEADTENFRKHLMPQKDLDAYPTEEELRELTEKTQEPTIPEKPKNEVSREEFILLFREASAKLDRDRYAIKIAATSKLHLPYLSVKNPLHMTVLMDCTDRDHPLYSQMRNIQIAGNFVKTDIYYQNDRLYTSSEEEKSMIMMLSDYFLEDYEAEWIFFDETMLENATITKNKDFSVTASARIDDHASEILNLISATYGDDFSYDQPILPYESPVTLTIDADGNISSFTLSTRVFVTEDRNGSQYSVSYTFEITLITSGDGVDIAFPDDLDTYKDITEEYYRNHP